MTLAARSLAVAQRLTDVAVSLEPGRITAICGPNGAGKSTLLQALAGLIEPDRGEVLLGDAALPTGRERARRIGYLPQVGEVAWDLSVAVSRKSPRHSPRSISRISPSVRSRRCRAESAPAPCSLASLPASPSGSSPTSRLPRSTSRISSRCSPACAKRPGAARAWCWCCTTSRWR